MATPYLSIEFADGSAETVRLSARALVQAERVYGDLERHRAEGTLYAAFWQLHEPGRDFDKWLESIEDFNEATGPAVPTPPEPSADS